MYLIKKSVHLSVLKYADFQVSFCECYFVF